MTVSVGWSVSVVVSPVDSLEAVALVAAGDRAVGAEVFAQRVDQRAAGRVGLGDRVAARVVAGVGVVAPRRPKTCR